LKFIPLAARLQFGDDWCMDVNTLTFKIVQQWAEYLNEATGRFCTRSRRSYASPKCPPVEKRGYVRA
jgi:hypothetical protein